MITLSELQQKEVVLMESGERLGFISDLEIDETNGIIKAIIISERQTGGSLFQRSTERMIAWEQIVIIGADIILIQDERLLEKEDITSSTMHGMNEES